MDQRDPLDGPDPLEVALTLHEAGRLVEAEGLYRKILQDDPNDLDALNLLGVILQERGQLAASIELLTQAVRQDPDFADAHSNLARAYRAAGQPQIAADHARRALVLDSSLAEAALILCRTLLDLHDVPAAADAGRQAVALAPQSFEAWSDLGLALENLKDWPAAADAYRSALKLQPSRVTILVKLGAVLSEMGQHSEASRYLRQAVTLAPNEMPPYTGLALALQRGGDISGSIVAYGRALEMAPERADIWRLQGSNYDALGRFDEAAECYQTALRLEPGSLQTRRDLAKIGKLGNDASEVEMLGQVLANDAVPRWDRIAAGFALGILLDKAASYDGAFASFKTANDMARAHYAELGDKFDGDKLRREVDTRITGFSRDALAAARPNDCPSEMPVFVVGMPRSGTTLVEQILSSHGRVHGAGETMDMQHIVDRLEQRQPGVHPLMRDQLAVRREADAHIERIRAIAGAADRVVDKLPDNILLLGQIATLFPRARIIICRRDPRDVCLSCYFQHFNDANAWSYDLADCATRACEIDRLTAFWLATLPLRMREVSYEALVSDLEGQSRSLIDFLGLEWDPACLDFHKTERTVLSASQWQVRQPLYTTSLGRWRHYRNHLGPLLAGLQPILPEDGTAQAC